MNNSFGLSEEQIETMLSQVSNNMGIDKEELRKSLNSGQLDHLLASGQDPKKAQVLRLMQDKELMDKFLSSDEAIAYMKNLTKEL